MKPLRTGIFGLIGLLVLSSCSLFGPAKPYDQGDRNDPLVLDKEHPDKRRIAKGEACKPIDYLLPWRLVHCER